MNTVKRDGTVLYNGQRIGRTFKSANRTWGAEHVSGAYVVGRKRQCDAVLALIALHKEAVR